MSIYPLNQKWNFTKKNFGNLNELLDGTTKVIPILVSALFIAKAEKQITRHIRISISLDLFLKM